MRRLVIASHHRLAQGMADTLQFVTGGRVCPITVCAYVDDVPLDAQIKDSISAFSDEDEVLIFTDMLQGSVNQEIMRIVNPGTFIVTGFNLPCVLELALYESKLNDEVIKDIVLRAREQLLYVNGIEEKPNEGDE